jgi:hypothetical protein
MGVTPNDDGDADLGPNEYQNFPRLTRATQDTAAKTVTVYGTLSGAANATVSLDLFGSFDCDPAGFGEGEYWVGDIDVTADDDGGAALEFTFSTVFLPAVPVYLTATSTDGDGNTSEFSACVEVTPDEGVFVVNSVGDGIHLKIVTNGGQEFSEGSEVSLDFALSDLYLFHVESKETLCEGIGDPDPDGRDAE